MPPLSLLPLCFNPRTYVRCDQTDSLKALIPAMFQSTHLREVRHTKTRMTGNAIEFQSTHLREVRQGTEYALIEFDELFQSTHLREVRQR